MLKMLAEDPSCAQVLLQTIICVCFMVLFTLSPCTPYPIAPIRTLLSSTTSSTTPFLIVQDECPLTITPEFFDNSSVTF